MKNKRKALIFSILPGGGHFYLGLYNRGIIFLISTMVLSMGVRNHGYGPFNMFNGLNDLFDNFAFIIWIYSAVDAYISADYINRGTINLEEESKFSASNKSLLATILSVIPGLGHMYEGHSDRGAKLLVTFIAGSVLSGLINVGLINTLLVLLSVYAVLDLISLREGKGLGFTSTSSMELKSVFKIAGIVLIVLGISQGFQIAATYLTDFGFNYILNIVSIFLKAAILVGIGLVILYKTRK